MIGPRARRSTGSVPLLAPPAYEPEFGAARGQSPVHGVNARSARDTEAVANRAWLRASAQEALMDIYGIDKTLSFWLRRLEHDPRVADQDKTAFRAFMRDAEARGITRNRVSKYAWLLRSIAHLFPGPVTEATEERVREYVLRLERSELSVWGKFDRKLVLKSFVRWLRGSEDYPPEVRWLKARIRRAETKLPEDLLSPEEVARLIRAADSARDRALIAVLYESGLRIGELLTMRVGSVRASEHGAELMVTGKTGPRRVLIVAAAPALFDWLKDHRGRDDPRAPLWITIGKTSYGEPMDYDAARMAIRRAATASGIRKRIHPHLFRHSRASALANRFTEAQMNAYFGWVQGSGMPGVYVHLSGRDVDNAVLALYGLRKDCSESIPQAPACPRCGTGVPPTAVTCPRCWLPLGARATAEPVRAGAATQEAVALIERLLENPKFVELLAEEKARAERERRDPRAVWPKSGPPHAA